MVLVVVIPTLVLLTSGNKQVTLLASLEARMGAVEERLTRVEGRVGNLTNKLDAFITDRNERVEVATLRGVPLRNRSCEGGMRC